MSSPLNTSLNVGSGKIGDEMFLPSAISDQEALIKVELDVIKSGCPSGEIEGEELKIANIQFNNLDFVGTFCNDRNLIMLY